MTKSIKLDKLDKILSKEYIKFLLEEAQSKQPKTWFEKLCKFSEILGLNPPKQIYEKLEKDIAFSSMNLTPKGVFSASILIFLVFSLISFGISMFSDSVGLMVLLVIIPLAASYYIYTYPAFTAHVQKVQTGDEAIKIILYMVIYLKLNPTFEGALVYASQHTKGPLSNDIKKALWDLQTGKYRSIEEALSKYIPKWVVWNEDFVRSLSLLYGVLIEPSEEGRENILKKSLDYLLSNTHARMKTYVENISGSITILHIMGILLPVMGLVMFPLISMFLQDSVNPAMMAVGYIIFLPTILYFFIIRILLKRPSAFMVPDVSKHPDLPSKGHFKASIFKKNVEIPILPVILIVFLVVSYYGIMHFSNLFFDLRHASKDLKDEIMKQEAKISIENLASSLSITLGIGLAVYLYFYLNSFQKIKIRNDIKNIEAEFQVGLFSLGNYLSEGYPIEKAVEKSLDEYEKLGMSKKPMYTFFQKLLKNIQNTGMTFKKAIFDKSLGVITFFPSVLIEEIMNVLSSASEKSSIVLGKVSKTIGEYMENLNSIEAKIKELLEDVRSGLRMQGGFVIPLVCAIVAALGIFILNMLVIISCEIKKIETSFGFSLFEGGDLINNLIGSFSKVMPMTLLQVIVGIYTIEITIIISILLNGIENGFDPVSRDYMIATTLSKALIIYSIALILCLFVFNNMIVSLLSSETGIFTCS
ncbi:MAG: hypothetical protein QXJ06_00455 [Candidatus Aenigmatarchaeota archaeon]